LVRILSNDLERFLLAWASCSTDDVELPMKIYMLLLLMSVFVGISYSAAWRQASTRHAIPRDSAAA
jgi:hypothetical protein